MRRIYLDYAALTPIDPRVMREMKSFSSADFANPSSIYREGVTAKKALDASRKTVADLIHAHADEIVFTSGGTEANGLALEGAARAAHRNGIAKPHLIISAIEHSSVIECAAMMEKQGVSVTRLRVDARGQISLEELKKSITPDTFLISIMTVNNEIGSLLPIREIAKIIREAKKQKSNKGMMAYPLFHTDAAQAGLYEDLNVEKLGVDLMTLDGSKIYGPRGVGALFVRRGTPIEQIICGGGQERGLRSGTENLPAIAGFAKAMLLAATDREKEYARTADLRNFFLQELQRIRPDIRVNGASDEEHASGDLPENDGKSVKKAEYAPHILNVSIPGIDNEFFVLQLDTKGVACSTKSSCLRDVDESYVLAALGADSRTCVRFSFGRFTQKIDLKRAILAISRLLC